MSDTGLAQEPAVSVVMPVYNAEQHLRKSVQSVLDQTLTDLELVCVDDCSTDHSISVLEQYAASDPRVRILRHSQNRGEGAARNTGLDNARGIFVFHLDADDWIPRQALEALHSAAWRYRSDMVKGSFVKESAGEARHMYWSTPPTKVINHNIFESSFLQDIPTGHWTYLYRRSFLDRHGIRYRTDLAAGLDLVALATALLKSEAVTMIPDIVYHYVQTPDSVTRGSISERVIVDSIVSQRIISEMLREAGLEEAAVRRLQRWRFQINEYWVRMARDLSRDACARVFDEFRLTVPAGSPPWESNMPLHQRYLLSLLLANRDDQALEYLRSDLALRGPSDRTELKKMVQFVVETMPDDASTLYELGCIEKREHHWRTALDLFREALKQDREYLDAQLEASEMLMRLGRPEDACKQLDFALGKAVQPLESRDQVGRMLSLRRSIEAESLSAAAEKTATLETALSSSQAERDALHRDLRTTRDENVRLSEELRSIARRVRRLETELDAIHQSTSWKLTAPLRRIKAALGRS